MLLERTVADLVEAPDRQAGRRRRRSPATPTWRRRSTDELRIAQQALLAVELKLKPEHPDVKRLRRTVDELQKRVEAQQLEGTLRRAAEPRRW